MNNKFSNSKIYFTKKYEIVAEYDIANQKTYQQLNIKYPSMIDCINNGYTEMLYYSINNNLKDFCHGDGDTTNHQLIQQCIIIRY